MLKRAGQLAAHQLVSPAWECFTSFMSTGRILQGGAEMFQGAPWRSRNGASISGRLESLGLLGDEGRGRAVSRIF